MVETYENDSAIRKRSDTGDSDTVMFHIHFRQQKEKNKDNVKRILFPVLKELV